MRPDSTATPRHARGASVAARFIGAAALAVIVLGSEQPVQAQTGGVEIAATAPPRVRQQQQTGRIAGQVVSTEDTRPVSGAQVFIEGTSNGALTDPQGHFVIGNVPVGTHTLVVQNIGFGTKRVTGVVVEDDRTTTLPISISPEAIALEAITVTATAERGSTAYLLDERRTASSVTDAIGSAEISRLPDSDAAEVAKRLTGATVTEGKYVFIRGLGERYSQTTLNGSPMPSPEPERDVVPLDLFSAGLLESLTAQKTYTPNLSGEFSGGSVAIKMRNLPPQAFLKVGVGTSINTESQFQDGFLAYPGGDLDYLGIDDGTRELPEGFNSILGGLRGDVFLRTLPSAQRMQLGLTLPREFTPVSKSTPLNRSFDVSAGAPFRLFGVNAGVFLGGSYSDKYTLRDNEIERKFTTSNFSPELNEDTPNVEYAFNRGIREVGLGGVVNGGIYFTDDQLLRVNLTFDRNTEDEARRFEGLNQEDLDGYVRGERLRFVSRELAMAQLSGEHLLPLGLSFEWRANIARATRDEPALREALYLRRNGSPDGQPLTLVNVGESGRYFFSELVDDDANAQADLSVPLGFLGDESVIRVGGAFRTRERDFAGRRFNWTFLPGFTTDLEQSLSEQTIVERVTRPGEFSLSEIVEPGDRYFADDERHAGYAMAELGLGERLKVIAGVRYEDYQLGIQSRTDTSAISQADWLPAVNVIYALTGRMNLRAAYSSTLDRPEFRELAPFQFTEATSLRQVIGNPDLDIAEFQNFDLRWEWFPAAGEILSASVFHKEIDSPIEQVYFAAASSAYSYQNADDGRLTGVELEAAKRLGFAGSLFERFTATANLSLIDSEVNVVERGAFVPTNLQRPLEGQSEYVVNLGLNYANPSGLGEVGVFYNAFGQRLSAAGGSGIPDIYEQPRHALDLTYSRDFMNGPRLKIKATNLLGADVEYTMIGNGIERIQRYYQLGRTFSIGLSYDL